MSGSGPANIGRNGESKGEACATVFLDDDPAEQDTLSSDQPGSPHEKTADILANTILSSGNKRTRVIALEGSWGAGKSSIVSMLKKRLSGNGNVAMLDFNAWQHQGDPLRRIFLESLVEEVLTRHKGWISDERKWRERIQRFTRRSRSSRTRSSRMMTPFAKALAFSALFVPLGTPFLGEGLQEGISFQLGSGIAWKFCIGLALTSLPLLVLLVNLFVSLVIKKGGNSFRAAWAFLSGEEVSVVDEDVLEMPDPTSIEFEREFGQLVGDIFRKHSERCLVIVLDNLDRVDGKTALSLWSTLQTFVNYEPAGGGSANVWILVPYDPKAIRALWDEASEGQPDGAFSTSLAQSFLDKSFQMRFEVPPAVLSNWKNYLLSLAQKAFPSHKPQELDGIYQIYDAMREPSDVSPTPRDLKLYVNQIGALHRQWEDRFTLVILAYYVLLRRKGQDVRISLLDEKFPPGSLLPALQATSSTEVKKNLAAICFSVPTDVAQQMILSEPLRLALLRGDPKVLKELLSQYQEGFWAVLEQVARVTLTGAPTPAFANVAYCLDSFGLTEYLSRFEVENIKKRLTEAFGAVPSWAPFGAEVSDGLVSACRIVPTFAFLQLLLGQVRKTLVGQGTQDTALAPVRVLVTGVVKFAEQIAALGQEELLAEGFQMPWDATQWLDACESIRGINERWWRLLIPRAAFADVAGAVVAGIAGGNAGKRIEDTVRVSNAALGVQNWAPVFSAIESRLNPTAATIPPKEVGTLCSLLVVMIDLGIDGSRQQLEMLIGGGHLLHAIQSAGGAKDTETESLLFALVLQYRPDVQSPPALGKSVQGFALYTSALQTDNKDLAALILGHLRAGRKLSSLWNVADARSNYDPLIVRALKLVCDGETPSELFTASQVLERWKDLKVALSDGDRPNRFTDMIANLCQTQNLVKVLLSTFPDFKPANAGLYLAIARAGIPHEFETWCAAGLHGVPKATWLTELVGFGDILQLALRLVADGKDLALKIEYQDALLEYARQSLALTAANHQSLASWRESLFGALAKSARKVLRGNLRDLAMQQEGSFKAGFFELFGAEISDREILLEDDDVVVKLLSAVVEKRSPFGLRWLAEILKKHEDILDAFRDAEKVENFRDRVASEARASTAGTGDETGSLLAEIATAIGIPEREGMAGTGKSRDA